MARGPWPRSGVRTRLPVAFRRVVDEFSPSDISGLALWLDASASGDLYTTDAGAVVPVNEPTEIAGCVGWWDASDASSITQSGGLVSELRDKSGQNNHATASGGLRPTLTGNALNGRSVLAFGGSQGLTGNLTTSVSSNAYSVFAVCRIAGAITNGRVFSTSASLNNDFASGNVIPCVSTGGTLTAFSGTAGAGVSSVTGFSSYGIFAGVLSSNLVANAANGMSNASTSATQSATVVRFGIGIAAQGGTGFNTADIAEIVYYNTALSTADRARVEAYLAQRWGISGVHAAATSASDPVGYWRDRSGNGRHAVQPTGANRPTISATAVNAKRALGFNGTAGRLAIPSMDSTPSTVLAVARHNSGTSSSGRTPLCIMEGANYMSWQFQQTGTVRAGVTYNASQSHFTAGGIDPQGAVLLMTGQMSSGGGGLLGRLNGAGLPFTETVAFADGGQSRIGCRFRNADDQFWSGEVCEVLHYQSTLPLSQVQRLERYLAAKWGIVLAPQVSNADAQDWVNRVYANGGTVTASTAAAVNQFCLDIENAPGGSLRDRFYRLNLFAGTGLNACLVPLYRGQSIGGTQFGGATDTNVGPFVSGDYAETNGLDGDGVTKYLNTGLSPDGMGVPATVHLAVFKGAGTWTTSREFIGTRDADDLYQLQMRYPASLVPSLSVLVGGSSSIISEVAVSTAASFLIATRSSSSDLFLWQNGTKIATGTTNATTPGACANPYMVFTRNASGTAASSQWEHAIRAYSIGLGLNDSQAVAYNTAMQTFQTALGRNV